MKPISVHIFEDDYQELKSMAARTGRPVAELVRQGLSDFVQRAQLGERSVLQLPAHDSGRPKDPWTRNEILDKIRGRT